MGLPSTSGASHATPRSRDDTRCDLLERGTVVTLHGLKDAQYNASRGTVSAFEPSGGRYKVTLENKSALSVKPAHVRQLVAGAKIVGTSQASLNGLVAPSATWDPIAARYLVEGLGRGPLSLKPQNVQVTLTLPVSHVSPICHTPHACCTRFILNLCKTSPDPQFDSTSCRHGAV